MSLLCVSFEVSGPRDVMRSLGDDTFEMRSRISVRFSAFYQCVCACSDISNFVQKRKKEKENKPLKIAFEDVSSISCRHLQLCMNRLQFDLPTFPIPPHNLAIFCLISSKILTSRSAFEFREKERVKLYASVVWIQINCVRCQFCKCWYCKKFHLCLSDTIPY